METVNIGHPIIKTKEDIQACKKILRASYPNIKDAYRYYAAKSPSHATKFIIWSIS